MSIFGHLYHGTTDINFPRVWKRMLVLSLLLIAVSITSFVLRGLNLSIDFEGGSVWEIPATEAQLSTQDAQAVLGPFGKESGAKVQEVTAPDGRRVVRVQANVKDPVEGTRITAAYAERMNVPTSEIATSTVGASWGSEITGKARNALIVFLVVIGLYISWTLEWRMAVAALLAVVHDIIITVGVYSVAQFEVTPATVISFLTILGFSLYDTIVVYDRVRENGMRFDRSGNYTYTAIMRRSLNQVLMRSVNTTLVAVLPVLAMFLIGAVAFGQPTLEEFSLALLVGLFLGAYSSVFVASPLTAWLKEREPKYRRIRQRLIDRGDLEKGEHIPVEIGMAMAEMPTQRTTPSRPGASARRGGGATAVAERPTDAADGVEDGEETVARPPSKLQTAAAARASQYQRAVPPRPRKQGKKR